MKLRRWSTLVLAFVALALIVEWEPFIPPNPLVGVAQVKAQPSFFPSRGGNQLIMYTASQSVVNSTTASNIFTGIIPAALFATPPSANVAATIGGGLSSVQTMSAFTTGMPAPLHVSLKGIFEWAAGTINMGVNFGGGQTGAATIALVNAFTPSAAVGSVAAGGASAAAQMSPIDIDCWIVPVATASGTLNSLGSALLSCRAEIPNGTSATPVYSNATIFKAANYTSTAFQAASPQVLNVIWQWGTANAANSLVIQGVSVTMGW